MFGRKAWKPVVYVIFALMLIGFSAVCVLAADSGGLPPADAFTPDSASFDAAKVLVTVILFFAGIAASVYFAIGIIKVIVKDVKELLAGEASLNSKKDRFMAIGVGFLILLLVISGKWYDLLRVLWDKILVPAFSKVS